jgi:hypothetical protein
MSGVESRFWLCPQCGKHVPNREPECQCGFSRTQEAGVDSVPAAEPSSVVDTGPSWFVVGPGKLVFMSVVTLGLYQIYWFYQHWRRVRDSGENVWPVPRSIFGVIFGYSLFRRVYQSAVTTPGATPGLLAVVYALLCLSAKLPQPFFLIALLSVVPLAVVQRLANGVALYDFPYADPNARLTAVNWVVALVGGAVLTLVGYGVFIRPRPTSIEYLSQVADELNRERRQGQDGVVLDRVVPEEGRLIYNFSVSGNARDRLEERRPRLKELLLLSTCRDRLLKLGASVRIVYFDANGKEVASVDVTPRDCGL